MDGSQSPRSCVLKHLIAKPAHEFYDYHNFALFPVL